ncbi:MAG: RNA polymerase sigma factor [Candidatus Eisenbacteria bacterium]|uniref:RNA polymerase sigma factor n=1 Tax=Eiseniibacteriota bacterium TaxID=2212470 RepID=A0A7Y2E584_UNCEI|nr:RNA polymerase sigma factor [Candidatus Eisenbacteria bacterium]
MASGQSNAVQECMDTYGGLVWSLALRFCPSRDDAEDAVQEIFVELWKSASRFDANQASEKGFIAMIARRRLIDRLRKAGRRPETTPIDEHGDRIPDESVKIENDAEAAIAANVLKDLKKEQRTAIELAVLDGMTHREVAETMRLPLGTVKSHIRRGLNLIRKQLVEPVPTGGAK